MDRKRIIIFIIFAFSVAWGTALAIFLTGGLGNSPMLVPELGISLAYVLMSTVYMFAPALANVLTRLITREGWDDLWLKPKLNGNGQYYASAWFLPGVLTILGAVAFYLLFPAYFDPKLSILKAQIEAVNQTAGSSSQITVFPWLLMAIQTIQAFLLAPVLNSISTFGEEFGWRAYLLPKMLPLGSKKAVLITAIIWGIWHWPLILMGYNYGSAYPGVPWMGLLMILWTTIGLGIIFSWLTLRSGSVWPAVIAHGALNGIAALGSLALKNASNPLLGPTPVGLVGGLFFAVFAINLFFHPTALKMPDNPDA